MKYKYTGDT